jgi:hypothetical protein
MPRLPAEFQAYQRQEETLGAYFQTQLDGRSKPLRARLSRNSMLRPLAGRKRGG